MTATYETLHLHSPITHVRIGHNLKTDRHVVAVYRGPVCRFYDVSLATIALLARTLRIRKAVFHGQETEHDLILELVTL